MNLFISREDFDSKMEAAGFNTTNCAYRAANSIISFAGGISIQDRSAVERGFAEVGYKPLEITIDKRDENQMKHRADVMCAACGMCVSVINALTDVQWVGLSATDRECPVFQ